jgi:ABC-type Na+ efflux pump permease subunit
MKQTSCESTTAPSTAATSITAEVAVDLNESDLSVVGLPPTPLKPEERPAKGVSSQILPLHRLSSESTLLRSAAASSAATSAPVPPPAYKEPPKPKPTLTGGGGESKHKPVAEVSPFSNVQVGLLLLLLSFPALWCRGWRVGSKFLKYQVVAT